MNINEVISQDISFKIKSVSLGKIHIMKYLYTLLCLLSCSLLLAQGSYFANGSLDNWTNVDGTTDMLSSVFVDGSSNDYLQKICDNTDTAVGQMAIKNSEDFNFNYNCGSSDLCGAELFIEARNHNNFPIHLRVGFKGSQNTTIVHTEALVVAANSEWSTHPYALSEHSYYTITEGSNSIEEVLDDVQEIRIIHNENTAFDGESEAGNLEIRSIEVVFLLETLENNISNVTVFPNPTKEFLNFNFPSETQGMIILNDLKGKVINKKSFQAKDISMDVSTLATGTYFATVTVNNSKKTFKVIKE